MYVSDFKDDAAALGTTAMSVMELVHKINSTYNQVNSNLLILKSEGIITEERLGRLRVIRLNKNNPKTVLILQALKILSNGDNIK